MSATTWQTFINQFTFGGLFSYLPGHPANEHFTDAERAVEKLEKVDFETHLYFCPAMRKRKGNTKEDVLGSKVLWVDYDFSEYPHATVPPSMAVMSGHGWHLYWILDEPITDIDELERLNGLLAFDLSLLNEKTAQLYNKTPEEFRSKIGECRNANRMLRMPFSLNVKRPEEPIRAELRLCNVQRVYCANDIKVLETLDPRMRNKIVTGSLRGHHSKGTDKSYDSRSERDWAVVNALIRAGASNNLVTTVFDVHAVGSKYRDSNTASTYLPTTIKKVRDTVEAKMAQRQSAGGSADPTVLETFIDEGADGYYMVGKTRRRFTTFTMYPQALLVGIDKEAEDAIVVDIRADGDVTEGVVFPRKAFNTKQAFVQHLNRAAWGFLGTDGDVAQLLPYLLQKLKDKGTPQVAATPVQGLHFVNGEPLFLGDQETLSSKEYWQKYDAPLVWLPSGKEHPRMHLKPGVTESELQFLRTHLPYVNTNEALWPVLGWFGASVIKPWIQLQGYRFPALAVMATKGSGKTSLLQQVLMPLFGQIGPDGIDSEPVAWDAGTTKFVKIALYGSSNAPVICFSEYRVETVSNNLFHYMRQAYDVGYEARGKSNQTTEAYPLTAPITLTGEDYISDPAMQERIVSAAFAPDTVAEDTPAYNAFMALQLKTPKGFAGYYIQRLLGMIEQGTLEPILQRTSDEFFAHTPNKIPTRIRRNYVVAMFGAKLVAQALSIEEPPVDWFMPSLAKVVDVNSGRSKTLADDFVESVVTAITLDSTPFRYKADGGTLYVHLSSTHNWWMMQCKRSGRAFLEREAVKQQLIEAPYYVGDKTKPTLVNGVPMHGISLEKAQALGLEVPTLLAEFNM